MAVSLQGRIASRVDREVRLISDDTFSELVLPLPDDLTFGYGDTRKVPENMATYDSILVVWMGASRSDGEIGFAEIREGASE